MTELIVGSVPRGEDYYGREDFIEGLWERLEHDNVLLAAPRRFGKTGAMFRLLDDPREPFRPLYINVEDITSAADFMVELLAALLRDQRFARLVSSLWDEARELGRFLRNLPTKIDLGGLKIELREKTDLDERWSEYGERALGLLTREGAPLLLLIDEFAIMVSAIGQRDRAEVVRFLRWFRAARLAPDTRTRFVLGSSVNLLATLEGMRLVDTVNDLAVVRLRPFPRDTAAGLVDAIFTGRSIAVAPEVREKILDLDEEPIPYLLQVLLGAILDRQRASKQPISIEMVEAAFEEDLLGGATAAVFHHYHSRLDEYYTDREARAARSILATLSRSDDFVSRQTLFQIYLQRTGLEANDDHTEDFLRLMSKLENDFYIVASGEGFRFYSRVLRLWWKARYGFQGG